MGNETPTFNLKAVVQETGLKPDTLRAWERRYGMPEPERTGGGHRIYSQEDINTLKWLLERQDEGMSISRAVDLLRRLQAEGKTPVLRQVTDSIGLMPTAAQADQETLSRSTNGANGAGNGGEVIAATRTAWITACLNFDEQRAESVLAQAFARYPIEAVCAEVLMKGLGDMGAGWYEGEVTVQQEHFASSLAMRRLEALLAATPAPTRRERVLIACPPEEEHTFVPLMLALMLRRQGLDVIYLGADVPLISLPDTLASAHPNLMIMTAQQLHTAATLMEMAQLVQSHGIPVAYGGLIFAQQPDLCARIPGHYLGSRLENAPQMVESFLRLPYAVPETVDSPEFAPLLAEFRRKRPAVEARLWQTMADKSVPQAHLRVATQNMSRNVDAALFLGDVHFLGNSIDWVQGLLVNHKVPAAALIPFIESYAEALAAEMPATHEPISRWLAGLAHA